MLRYNPKQIGTQCLSCALGYTLPFVSFEGYYPLNHSRTVANIFRLEASGKIAKNQL
jgi:hypothetical protein